MIKVRRMCGGGMWRWWRYADVRPWKFRRVSGAVINDWAGWALAWAGDWGKAKAPRWWPPLVCRVRGHHPVKHISGARVRHADEFGLAMEMTGWRLVCSRCHALLDLYDKDDDAD